MPDFRDIPEFRASAQISEIPRSRQSPNPQSAPVPGLVAETLSSAPGSYLCETPIG